MMPSVDFYILPAASVTDTLPFVCRLAEKAWRSTQRIYIHTDQIAQLDTLLWTYRDEGFLPHQPYIATPPTVPAIEIGIAASPADRFDILINLSQQMPDFYKQFKRILEIIPGNHVDARTAARERFRFYQTQQCTIQTHQPETV